ncbi:DUF808 domain-containing protein [Lonepinella koalarum]|uniref:Inner membrane protein YedI n=1 Tax=Lonepinella koalarum TaxID=53417 RepID=A0A4R1KYA1_9PAST|nr:DUF808 domain-containing protein [Lonepinella koalarum]MDH2926875.1 hypothetical protein [Lonepinella koalarum]TCK70466.1 hypothetical protein EV692_0742 [Lonepinella koalarum]TFJ90147.1 DUF808 domain-containing protein [Lonepinella koalarum]
MAFSSLFTLLDDIASVLDDVALMTKVAAKKTVGVISDDLTLNATQVSGKDVAASRELPIVWAVAKGSLWNKAILIPLALLLAIYLPSFINILLMIGGAYLCFEGMEKLIHKFLPKNQKNLDRTLNETTSSEKEKITGAIKTDFILSAEIIIIALGSIQDAELLPKILTLLAIGIGITFFVYGLVGLIVKLDDVGLWLIKKENPMTQPIGKFLLFFMPWFMKSLSVIGVIAMFMVGGGIFVHYLPILHHFIENLQLDSPFSILADLSVGIFIGTICCIIVLPLMTLFSKKQHQSIN